MFNEFNNFVGKNTNTDTNPNNPINQKNQIIAEYATSLLNDLDRIHYRLDEILIDYSTLSKALEKEYFDRLEIFDAILYSVYAVHGLEIDDRKFYFNPFSRKFLPIFYHF